MVSPEITFRYPESTYFRITVVASQKHALCVLLHNQEQNQTPRLIQHEEEHPNKSGSPFEEGQEKIGIMRTSFFTGQTQAGMLTDKGHLLRL